MQYKAYLKSEHWQNTRKKKYIKKDRACAICGAKKQLDVHHLTYDNVGNESTEELRVLCRQCHQLVHKIMPNLKTKKGIPYKELSNQGKFTLVKGKVKRFLLEKERKEKGLTLF